MRWGLRIAAKPWEQARNLETGARQGGGGGGAACPAPAFPALGARGRSARGRLKWLPPRSDSHHPHCCQGGRLGTQRGRALVGEGRLARALARPRLLKEAGSAFQKLKCNIDEVASFESPRRSSQPWVVGRAGRGPPV